MRRVTWVNSDLSTGRFFLSRRLDRPKLSGTVARPFIVFIGLVGVRDWSGWCERLVRLV